MLNRQLFVKVVDMRTKLDTRPVLWSSAVLVHWPTWWRGRPTIDGKTALGASSPPKPALHIPDPLSTTRAAMSSTILRYAVSRGSDWDERCRQGERNITNWSSTVSFINDHYHNALGNKNTQLHSESFVRPIRIYMLVHFIIDISNFAYTPLETVQSVGIRNSSLETKIENAFVLGIIPAVKLMIRTVIYEILWWAAGYYVDSSRDIVLLILLL